MATLDLKVEKREKSGKEAAKVLRRNGQVPAVIYGHKEEPQNLTVNFRELNDLLHHHGLTSLISLTGAGKTETAFIKSVQRHPVKGTPITVDFVRVSRNEEIHIKVPIVLTGESVAVRSGEGFLIQSLQEVEISGTPNSLPDSIEVDISHLELDGHALHVSDIKAPNGVKILTSGEEAVAAINHPRRAEVEVEPIAEGTGEAEAIEEAQDVTAEHGSPAAASETTAASND